MSPARALTAISVVLACAAQSPAPDVAPLTGDQVLARAKAVFRSYPRPAFIAYTLVRRQRHNGEPDLANSYTLKIWCRTADHSALARRAWNGTAYGELQNITVAFDRAVDPGPPTADMFERRLFGATSARRDDVPAPAATTAGTASAAPELALPAIGRVGARDGDYRTARMTREGELIHLWLETKSDPDRNRVDELWVDARTYDVRRAKVRDHLYFFGGQTLDDDFDVRFTPGPGGLPLVSSIHTQTKFAQYESDYTYKDIAFPPALPDWYFTPTQYGLHRAEAPA